MLALPSPLNDSTNRDFHEEAMEAAPTPVCFLSLLAEASLGHDAKRARTTPGASFPPSSLECGEVAGEWGEKAHVPAPLETAVRPRCPSRHSADATSSRSTSPSTGSAGHPDKAHPGKMYRCNKCAREYASTDAVRKHARQNHPEWLKEQGQGCPSLYCTVVEHHAANAENNAALAMTTWPPRAYPRVMGRHW